jgi:xanthine/CO dehydrogenase XdhC/CoxF family maturation factor
MVNAGKELIAAMSPVFQTSTNLRASAAGVSPADGEDAGACAEVCGGDAGVLFCALNNKQQAAVKIVTITARFTELILLKSGLEYRGGKALAKPVRPQF